MRAIRRLFNLQTIYFKQTAIHILYFYTFVAIFLWIVIALGKNSIELPPYVFIAVFLAVAYALVRTILRTVLVNNYINQHRESLLVIRPAEIANSSVNLELDKIDQLKPIVVYKNARIFIATFNFYRNTKHGEYLAKQAFYIVLEVQLNRRLPHILFDSRIAKKQQFKNLYLRAQRLSVQGSFDEIFDTYVPQTYNIDTLSFVTPEVMEALVEARMYDIEILNDKVLLYAPLINKEEVDSFADKGRVIAEHLNDNIDTYRDNRLTGNNRSTDVTLFARSLLRSPRKYLILACLSAFVIIAIIFWAITVEPEYRDDILFNQISLLIYLIFIGNSWEASTILRNNHKALEHYRNLHQSTAGKPIKQTIV